MGSINGGTTITIFGEYFDPNATDIEVLVGGEIIFYVFNVFPFIYIYVTIAKYLHAHFHLATIQTDVSSITRQA